MRINVHRKLLATSLALILTGVASAALADSPQAATDIGAAPTNQQVHVTLMLKLRNPAALQQFVQDTATPGNRNYQQFLTTSQFASQYGATDAQIAKVQAYLQKQGLSATVLPNHLAIQTTGTVGQFNSLFQTSVHQFVSRKSGRQFHRPVGALLLPASLADTVNFATGLSTEIKYHSHRLSKPQFAQNKGLLAPAAMALGKGAGGNPTATGQPGNYTVGDVANFYNINPLYQRGVTGKGSTIAIVTLSNFYPADAQTYWTDIGLSTKPNRIKQIHVDGGGAIDDGSGETSLDVEQSGGLAPYADILVYDAPNAGNGFTDAFLQAVSDNKADSISTSWGGPEMFNFAALNITSASNTDTSDVGDLRAFDQIFLEAAAQGQSVFAAAGDDGAYDTTSALACGDPAVHPCGSDFSSPLSVDSPASDPYITAAGGTTRPYSYSFSGGPTASIKQESVWGWDYIQNYFDTNFGPGIVDTFSVGGGGGVSVYWRKPWYQWLTRGIENSQKKQSLIENDPPAAPTTLLKLPANFAGRNMPDVALNADPETGYIVYSTADGGVINGYGGTSFVAPQLNGISALLMQSAHHRIGFWNPHVYLLQAIFGSGKYGAFNNVTAGDNWFYQGKPGFNPGSGLGTLNVANFDLLLRSGF